MKWTLPGQSSSFFLQKGQRRLPHGHRSTLHKRRSLEHGRARTRPVAPVPYAPLPNFSVCFTTSGFIKRHPRRFFGLSFDPAQSPLTCIFFDNHPSSSTPAPQKNLVTSYPKCGGRNTIFFYGIPYPFTPMAYSFMAASPCPPLPCLTVRRDDFFSGIPHPLFFRLGFVGGPPPPLRQVVNLRLPVSLRCIPVCANVATTSLLSLPP